MVLAFKAISKMASHIVYFWRKEGEKILHRPQVWLKKHNFQMNIQAFQTPTFVSPSHSFIYLATISTSCILETEPFLCSCNI